MAGFSRGLVVDDPESKKNKKYYLVLSSGAPPLGEEQVNLDGVTMDEENINQTRQLRQRLKNGKDKESAKTFILRKKELMKRRGRKVAKDSKFTGRKRRHRF